MKTKKLYYISLKKEDNTIQVSTTKASAARFVGTSVDTIRRNMKDNLLDRPQYTIWKNISIVTLRRGFALKKHHPLYRFE